MNQATDTAEKTDHRWLLLVRQNLDIGQPCGVSHGDMDLVVADAIGAALLAVTGDAVPLLAKASQQLDVDVDQIARFLPLVTMHRWLVFKVSQAAQTKTAEGPGDGGEGRLQQPGDVPQMQALMAEFHGVLQLLRIEGPPLDAANTPSIRQRGWTAREVTSQPAIGAPEADSDLSGQL